MPPSSRDQHVSEAQPHVTPDGDHAVAGTSSPTRPSPSRPEDPDDPALDEETMGIDSTDTALSTEDATNPAE